MTNQRAQLEPCYRNLEILERELNQIMLSYSTAGGNRVFAIVGKGVGEGGFPQPAQNLLIPPPPVDSHPTKSKFSSYCPIKKSFFSCSHYSCTIFVLISYYLDTQSMLSLILIDVL